MNEVKIDVVDQKVITQEMIDGYRESFEMPVTCGISGHVVEAGEEVQIQQVSDGKSEPYMRIVMVKHLPQELPEEKPADDGQLMPGGQQ